MKRLCIYPKDVQVITGKSSRHSRYLVHIIKQSLGKKEHQLLTIKEFCQFTGVPQNEVEAALEGKPSPQI
jgi:hypothetical protein